MALFDDAKFTEVITTHAAKVWGAAAAIPTDWMSALLDLFTGFLTGCISPTPTPPASDVVAAQIKGAGQLEQRIILRRVRKHYASMGMSRLYADNAFATMTSTVADTPVADLSLAIDHARQDASSVPDFNLN
jgi:hypothetical protein